ncbi:hypothetical protein VK95_23430 [Leclercia sp. LK8]|nr:hypothetical protein VK95_23430 [Leclercia sp. LK8]
MTLIAAADIAKILAEIILNERAGFKFQRAEIADCAQLCGQMQLHKIPGNIRLRKELPERGGNVQGKAAVRWFADATGLRRPGCRSSDHGLRTEQNDEGGYA